MKHKLKMYLQLFYYMFITSMTTFGGGFVIVPLYKKTFVDKLKWISEDDMMDLIVIAQSSPGSIAINASILVGQKVFGAIGTLIAVIATATPPIIIISVVAMFYEMFKSNLFIHYLLMAMRGVIAAIILDVSVNMAFQIAKKKDYIGIIVMLIALGISVFLEINVIYIIIGAALIGLVRSIIEMKKKVKQPAEETVGTVSESEGKTEAVESEENIETEQSEQTKEDEK